MCPGVPFVSSHDLCCVCLRPKLFFKDTSDDGLASIHIPPFILIMFIRFLSLTAVVSWGTRD